MRLETKKNLKDQSWLLESEISFVHASPILKCEGLTFLEVLNVASWELRIWLAHKMIIKIKNTMKCNRASNYLSMPM